MDTDEPQLPSADDLHEVVENCAEAVAELFTFLDGALTEERRALITDHLEQCAPCFDAFEFHIELRAVIQQRCRTELPEGLRERIFRQLHDQLPDTQGSLGS